MRSRATASSPSVGRNVPYRKERGKSLPEFGSVRSAADRELESGLAEMRAHLERLHPSTYAEALQALRAAFPGTPLSSRVAAINAPQSG